MEKLATYMAQPNVNALYRAQHTHWPESIVLEAQEPKGITWDQSLTEEIPDFVAQMQRMDLIQYLPDDILTKIDRATMAVGLEARVPLLDHRIVEFAWRLPATMKIRGAEQKWILRQVLYNYVPRELVDRPKMGFGAPIAGWLRGSLKDWAEALIEPRRLLNEGYFSVAPITRTWQAFLKGDDRLRERLWGILMFQSWLEMNRSIDR